MQTYQGEEGKVGILASPPRLDSGGIFSKELLGSVVSFHVRIGNHMRIGNSFLESSGV